MRDVGLALVQNKLMGLFKTKKIDPGKSMIAEMNEHQDSKIHLDIMLINLLFKSKNKTIEREALSLIIFNFNQRARFKEELEEIHLLFTPKQRLFYKRIQKEVLSIEKALSSLVNLGDLLRFEESNLNEDVLNSVISDVEKELHKLIKILSIRNDPEAVTLSQGIARNLGIHEILISFLKQDFKWLSKVTADKITINPYVKNVYKSVIRTLAAFSFKNVKNQQILFDYLGKIVIFVGNGCGVSSLLSQILAGQRNKDAAEKIIDYIFTLINMDKRKESNPQDFRMLRSLLIDENNEIYTTCQTNVVKAIVKNKLIMDNYYNYKLGTWNFMNFNLEFYRFHSTLMLLLSNCSIHNLFAVQQIRKLIPYQSLITEISRYDLSYKVKGSYLHLLFFVYFVDISEELQRELDFYHLKIILKEIIIQDINRSLEAIPDLLNLCNKKKYKCVSHVDYIEDDDNRPNKLDMGSSQTAFKAVLNQAEIEARDFWKYILCVKP